MDSTSAGLTDREAQVLRLIAHGLSNAKIVAQLFVSADPVKTHVVHMLTKLDARDGVFASTVTFDPDQAIDFFSLAPPKPSDPPHART